MKVKPIAGAAGVTGDVPAGLEDTADGDDARFDDCGDIFVDSSRSLVWFLDRNNLAVRTVSLDSNVVATVVRFPDPLTELDPDPPGATTVRHLWVDDDYLVVVGGGGGVGTWGGWIAFVDRDTGTVTDWVSMPEEPYGHVARVPNADGTWRDEFYVKGGYNDGLRSPWYKIMRSGGTWTRTTGFDGDVSHEAVVPGPGGPGGAWTVWRYVGYVYPSYQGFANIVGAWAGQLEGPRPYQLVRSPFGWPADGITILGASDGGYDDLTHFTFADNEWVPWGPEEYRFPLGFDVGAFVGIAADPVSRTLFFTSATQVWMTEPGGGGWQTRAVLR